MTNEFPYFFIIVTLVLGTDNGYGLIVTIDNKCCYVKNVQDLVLVKGVSSRMEQREMEQGGRWQYLKR